MKFSRWLNSLGFPEFLTLLILLLSAAYLANLSFLMFKNWYDNKQKDNPYAEEVRSSPFLFVAITIPYFLILFGILYRHVHALLDKIF
jgi:hypothetical protein